MSTDRATGDASTLFSPGAATPPPADVESPPQLAATDYPPPPSAAACGALVPCRHPAEGCPVGVDIPSVARAIAGGNQETAYRLVRAAHPFASTCGTACEAPCESACRRRPFGAPVAIAALEEFAAGFGPPVLSVPNGPCTSRFEARSVAGAVDRDVQAALAAPRSGKTVAIVGSGPAGLACAHDLTLLGHRVLVLDARSEPGGLMTGGIPAFRFPVVSAKAECAAIVELGAEFRGERKVMSLRSVFADGADAVFLAHGASRPGRSLVESAQQHRDIFDAMGVLTSDIGPLGETIVAGEGALAIDAARVIAKRAASSGATDVRVQLVLTSPLAAASHSPAQLASCARDGVRILHAWRVRRAHIDPDSGLLTSIDVAAPDGSSARVLACDRLIVAGPRIPDPALFAGEVNVTRDGFIAVDPHTLRTSAPNVWAGGACAFGHRSIAHAVADGKRAAWEIHASLVGARVTTMFASAWVEANGRRKADRTAADRRRALPLLEPPPIDPFAPASSRAASRAGEEAARCFDCSQIPIVVRECTSCGGCVESCPTGAITLADKQLAIQAELCNRCGVCVSGCPEEALTMLRAEWEERLRFV
ncbi:MAG: FAD-dependent oxidoreductase [Gemmatimonadaceae bacterium]